MRASSSLGSVQRLSLRSLTWPRDWPRPPETVSSSARSIVCNLVMGRLLERVVDVVLVVADAADAPARFIELVLVDDLAVLRALRPVDELLKLRGLAADVHRAPAP